MPLGGWVGRASGNDNDKKGKAEGGQGMASFPLKTPYVQSPNPKGPKGRVRRVLSSQLVFINLIVHCD